MKQVLKKEVKLLHFWQQNSSISIWALQHYQSVSFSMFFYNLVFPCFKQTKGQMSRSFRKSKNRKPSKTEDTADNNFQRETGNTCNKSWRVWLAAIKTYKDTWKNGHNVTVHGRVAMETGTQQEEGQNISHQRHQVRLKGSHHRKAHSNNV